MLLAGATLPCLWSQRKCWLCLLWLLGNQTSQRRLSRHTDFGKSTKAVPHHLLDKGSGQAHASWIEATSAGCQGQDQPFTSYHHHPYSSPLEWLVCHSPNPFQPAYTCQPNMSQRGIHGPSLHPSSFPFASLGSFRLLNVELRTLCVLGKCSSTEHLSLYLLF